MMNNLTDGDISTNINIPYESLGKIFYNKMKTMDANQVCMIDVKTGEEITYGKLQKLSVILANELKKLGVEKNTVITIASSNSWKYILTIMASIYLGAQLNLLNPEYSAEELQILLSTCQPSLLFCSENFWNNILKLKDTVLFPESIVIFGDNETNQISFDRLLENNENYSDFSSIETDPDDVALILTSSGTSGFPKYVLLTYENLYSQILVQKQTDFFDINENQIVIGFLPFFHIYGVVIFLSCVLHDSKLIILEKFLLDTFLKTIEDYKITKLFVVPSVLLLLAKNSLRVEKYDLSSVQDIVSGAAVCTKELEKLIQESFGLSVRQAYGMTEVTGPVTVVLKRSKELGSVGKIIPKTQIKICDVKSGDQLPFNCVGELRIKGSVVMKGYLHNQEATEAIFDENGFIKSGDLGYFDEDGFLYVVNRMKEIIKYKGYQVAPAELENLLICHPVVKEVAVTAKPDEYAGELATAFIVKEPNKSVTEEEIIRYIEENMSEQKWLHGGVKFLEEIPRNSTGKILRYKLKELLKVMSK